MSDEPAVPPLRPCPLCGGAARLTHIDDPDDEEVIGVRQAIQCTDPTCLLTLEDWEAIGTEHLTDKWNQRMKESR
jgi:hypothetical protein